MSQKSFIALNANTLSTLAFKDDKISATYTPQLLTKPTKEKALVNLHIVRQKIIEPYLERLVQVTSLIDGLFTIETHQKL